MSGPSRWPSLNPPATAAEYADALRRAKSIADSYMRRGARAVLLAGSWTRGDARRWSDLDLWVLGRRSAQRVLRRDGMIITVKETTAERERRELQDPRVLGQAVLAWREARVLADSHRVAARLQVRARAFRWEDVRSRCDRFVARSLAEWAEEAVKVTRFLADGLWESAAVQRNLLVNDLAVLMAIRLRVFYHENGLWEVVGARMGPTWHRWQRTALSLGGASLTRSCEASLRLYCLSARAAKDLLRDRERAVVARVGELCGMPL